MAKNKYYVVWVGKNPGVYTSWSECQDQVNQFEAARFKSYESRSEAEQAYRDGWKKHWGHATQLMAKPGTKQIAKPDTKQIAKPSAQQIGKPSSQLAKPGTNAAGNSSLDVDGAIDWDSISVDVGTKGNPGVVEYKGVNTRTGEVIFSKGPISKGTNNLGEFLAIVHALAYLKERKSTKTVYSDSRNALKWVKQREVSSTLERDKSTEEIWNLVDRALKWLRTHTYENKVLKWETKDWGEIKADYGRK